MDFPHLERLTRAECRRLLPAATVGRLAVPTPNFPTVEPVSFTLVEGEVVVAVRAGSAADAVPAGTVLTFEADVLDHADQGGWSVVVSGPVEELADEVVALVRPQLRPWPAADNDRFLLVRSERVTGQRIVTGVVSTAEEGATITVAEPSSPATEGEEPKRFTRRLIDTDEGLVLLARGGQHVGRLVVTVSGEPDIFPLNFAVDGEAIIFRTRTGTKLTGITRSLATFEVDDIDAAGEGWAVTFEGLAQEVLDADPESMRERIAAIDLETWPGGDRPHVVRIRPYRVHGTAWSAVPAPVAADAVPGSPHQA